MARKGVHLCQQPMPKVFARSHFQMMEPLTNPEHSAYRKSFADKAHTGTRIALAEQRCSHPTFASSLGLEVLDGSPPPVLLSIRHQPHLRHRNALLLQPPALRGSAADTAQHCRQTFMLHTAGGPAVPQEIQRCPSAAWRKQRLSLSAQAEERLHKALALQTSIQTV